MLFPFFSTLMPMSSSAAVNALTLAPNIMYPVHCNLKISVNDDRFEKKHSRLIGFGNYAVYDINSGCS